MPTRGSGRGVQQLCTGTSQWLYRYNHQPCTGTAISPVPVQARQNEIRESAKSCFFGFWCKALNHNSLDTCHRSEHSQRPTRKSEKAQNTPKTLEPRNLQRSSVLQCTRIKVEGLSCTYATCGAM
uniref:Uncharacterized protein n=1 Tax=Ananas comosus var. bracteatus TaxID=296719 RepID=A0A6V7P9V7_ANACO|nr:unnamed protein product [Ananas comosus var. bracteatus]